MGLIVISQIYLPSFVQQSIPDGPLAQLLLPQISVPSQSVWWSQSPSPSEQGDPWPHLDQSVVSEFKRHWLRSMSHSPLVHWEALMHACVQQFCRVPLGQFLNPQTSDPSHSVSNWQSPSPSAQSVTEQYPGHKLQDFMHSFCTNPNVQKPASTNKGQPDLQSLHSGSAKNK